MTWRGVAASAVLVGGYAALLVAYFRVRRWWRDRWHLSPSWPGRREES